MLTAQFPNRYVQGPGALGRFGTEAARLGEHALLVIDRNLPEAALSALDTSGIEATRAPVEPACTPERIEAVSALARETGADMIAGFGGGKVIDLGRAAADALRLPFVSVPTVAASDAPCSALSVIYDDAGRVLEDRFLRKNPDLVLVDSAVIARAPVRFLAAGIGDALATFFEADACIRSGAKNMVGGRQTRLAGAVARLCLDTILEHGAAAIAACKRAEPDAAFEHVLEAAILLSGIGFESGGVAAAHAFHHGIAELPESHGALHGEKVAFGVLAGLALATEDNARIAEIAAFNRAVGLPVCLEDLGITRTDRALSVIATRACRPSEIIHNEPRKISIEAAVQALARADAIGHSLSAPLAETNVS